MAADSPSTVDKSTRLTRALGAATGKMGSVPAILIAVALVLVWLAEGVAKVASTGKWSAFLESTYQLQINTTTTVVTFLMCFIIQNTQNRDGRAVEVKLDAIMEALNMDSDLVGLEDAPESMIKAEQTKIRHLADVPKES